MLQEIINNLVSVLNRNQPNLNDLKQWFINDMLPQRSGADLDRTNRIPKGAKAFFFENNPDPHGVCGDVTLYMFRSFESKFPGFLPSISGYNIGAVLKEGISVTNHIANIIYPFDLEKFLPINLPVGDNRLMEPFRRYCAENVSLSHLENDIYVFDLFYIESPQTLLEWLTKRDYSEATLTIGREYDFT